MTGTANPGTLVTIYDAAGRPIGVGLSDANGNFTADLNRTLVEGETIYATQVVDGVESERDSAVVTGAEVMPPTITTAVGGTNKVTGTGVPGSTVFIYDANGNLLGAATTGSNGIYSATTNRPLVGGETIYASQTVDGTSSDRTSGVVTNQEVPAPGISSAVGGTSTVVGTGVPGSQVTIYDANGNVLGTAITDNTGKYTVTTNRPLVGGETIYAGQAIDGVASDRTAGVVSNQEVPSPTITEAVGGTNEVTGHGVPGSTVFIYDANGNLLGAAITNDSGIYTVTTNRDLVSGETIYAEQSVDGAMSDRTSGVVSNEEVPAPTITTAEGGTTTVTGTGEVGGIVVIYDANGNLLGAGAVDASGNYSVNVNRPLVPGETIYADQTIDGVKSDQTSTVVGSHELPAPEITEAVGGTTTINGNGEAGSLVAVYDENGNLLGAAIVGADGKFTVTSNRPLVGGETLTVNQSLDGVQSDSSTYTVSPAVVPVPGINDMNDGDTTVSGTGVAGGVVLLTDEDGNILGTGIVGEDGTYSIDTNRPLVGGETVIASQTANGTTSDQTSKVVQESPLAPPSNVIASSVTHNLTGTGEPGATILIYDAVGNEIGTTVVDENGDFIFALPEYISAGDLLVVYQQDGDRLSLGTPVVVR